MVTDMGAGFGALRLLGGACLKGKVKVAEENVNDYQQLIQSLKS